MFVGNQMRLWSCVPERTQMPPLHHPQVQILWRWHAHRYLRKGERETVVSHGMSHGMFGTEISFFVLKFFTLLCLLCLYSINVKLCSLNLLNAKEGCLLHM